MNSSIFRVLPNCGAIVLGFLGIIALPAQELIAQQPGETPTQPPAQSATPEPGKAPAPTWEKRHAGDVSVEAPFAIEDGPDVFSKAPEKLRDTVVSVKTFRAGGPQQGFRLTITTIIYKPGVPVDIDGATKGVMAKIAEFVGDPNHRFTIAPIKISGLEARHSEFHGTIQTGRPFYSSLAVLQQGQKLWQVQAFCMNEAMVQDLARVMGSIAIEPAPAP